MTFRRRVYVLVGTVTADDERTVLDLAEGRGFTVIGAHEALRPEMLVKIRAQAYRLDHPLPKPEWEPVQLYRVRPADYMPDSRVARNVARYMQTDSISTAADLTRISFAHFMRPRGGLTPGFANRAHVLDFMIKNGVPFRDLNPAEVFYTRTADVPQLKPFCVMLEQRGIKWFEIFAFLTPEQLHANGFLSVKQVNAVEAALHDAALEFSSGH